MRWWSVGLLLAVAGFVAMGVVASTSCGPPTNPAAQSGENALAEPLDDATCVTRRPAWQPENAAPGPAPLAVSELVITGHVPLARVADEIAGHVPKVVASGSRKPIGAPGEATYKVTRGGFAVALSGEDLVVTTPLSVQAEVCKPLGPMCPTYASCSPELLATARVPLSLGPHLEVGKSRVGVTVTRPCSIAGIDVTSKMMQVASRQTANVQEQIDRSIPPLRGPAGEAWRRLHTTVPLERGACLRVVPISFSQAAPTSKDDALTLRGGVTGTFEVLRNCSAPNLLDERLPDLMKVESLPGQGSIRVAVRSDEPSAQRLVDSLRTLPTVENARVTPSEVDGRGVLALGLTLSGESCGEVWLASDLVWDEDEKALRLAGLRPFPGQPADAASAAKALLLTGELGAIRVDLPQVGSVHRALQQQLARVGDLHVEGAELVVEVSEPRVTGVAVDADGVVAILAASSKIEVRMR